MKEVLKGFNSCAVKLGERLNWWNSNYQPIVSQDKDAFIKRYAKTERPLSVAGQDIQRYREVQLDITQEDHKAVIAFIETGILADTKQKSILKILFTRVICNLLKRFRSPQNRSH